jgi:pyrroline-5-carboxylate reductase
MAMTVVLVGCGNMGRAMLEGWLATGRLAAAEVLVVEPAEALRDRAAALGVAVAADAGEIGADAAPRLVVFALKPQIILDIVPAYARFRAGATYVSVAAGTPIAAFERLLGADAAILRCMPNTPAAIGKGMMVTFANARVKPQDAAFIADLLAASGKVTSIADESLMDAVTAVSGSGPAYVFHFIECLTAAGEAAGLPAETERHHCGRAFRADGRGPAEDACHRGRRGRTRPRRRTRPLRQQSSGKLALLGWRRSMAGNLRAWERVRQTRRECG